jgi:hypothetical protein
MESWQDTVTKWALIIGGICFLIYVIEVVVSLFSKPPEEATEMAKAGRSIIPNGTVTGADFAKILEAIAKIGDSLAKAGPALTSLIGAVLFFTIAMVSSGALKSSASSLPPPVATPAGNSTAASNVTDTVNNTTATK